MFDAMSSFSIPNKEIIYNVSKRKLVREITNAPNPYTGVKMGTAEYGTIKAGDGKTDLNYRLIKPSNFDASKKYPVMVYVYGGPHAQMITNSWLGGADLWMYWMAEQGYLVYTVDNRGSDNRGFEFESVIHRQLGTAELEDQMAGVKHLKSMSFVDGDRLAVHGWSYGGFMTTSLMLRQPGTFNVGVAGGPVTDWKYYEIMYGERYMDRPEDNVDGYAKNSLSNYASDLEGELLLIHGTSDDVVVMQHSLTLVQAFIEAGVQMDFFPYPMHEHNVRGKDRVHLMEKVLNYIIENNQ
jgi:dipeptidyl-peptidase-4